MSGRDGAVAFLYYLELYLRRARTQYPDLYAQLKAEPQWVELVQRSITTGPYSFAYRP